MFLLRLACGTGVLLFAPICLAAEPGAEAASALRPHGLAPLDWGIIAAYVLMTLALGWYYGRKQETTQEYFVGSGRMNPVLIGVSLFATLLSTISYMSMPGEALGKGPVMMSTMVAAPLAFLIVGYVLLPVYMRQRVTSAYELLEAKLGLSIRLLGASMFLLLRLVWMSLLVFLTAKAMVVMMGLGDEHISTVAIVTGTVAVVYTSIGGLRAVVMTDFIQTVLLWGGALLVLGVVTFDQGGFGWFPTQWHANWDTQPLVSFDPSTRVTVLGAIVSYLIWVVCTAGGDQTSVQRFMATEDASAARRAYGIQICSTVVITTTLYLVGFALLSYFEANPEAVPAGKTLKKDADLLFPHFIAYHLPMGISGLVVAGMFAAAMSSIDSGVNSITAVVMRDFMDRFGLQPRSEKQHVLFARLLAFTVGAAVVTCSSLMGNVPGNITAVTQKTSNLLTTPIFALFFFALFVPFARAAGVWAGAIVGTATAVAVAFSGPLVLLLHTQFGIDPSVFGAELLRTTNEAGVVSLSVPDPISFQWIAPLALGANILTGCLVSWALGGRGDRAADDDDAGNALD